MTPRMNIRELARRAQLSKSTISLALRNDPQIPYATRARVQLLAKKLSYKPDPTLASVMSVIARRETVTATAPIAILTNWGARSPWKLPANTLKRFFHGLNQRAADLGYKVEEFWLREKGMTDARMERILRARGIDGVVVFNYVSAPATLDIGFTELAGAVIGRALNRPRLNAVDQDHHQGVLLALERALMHGYKRPGLILSTNGNERTMHCWAAAYQFFISTRPAAERLPILILDEMDLKSFRAWHRKQHPDTVLADSSAYLPLIKSAGLRVPDDLGYISLNWQSAEESIAGIDLRDEAIASRAVELVVEQLRQNQRGVPQNPETVLFDGVWRDGASIRNIQ